MNSYSSQEEFDNPFEAPSARPTPAYKPTGDAWVESSDEVDEATRRAYIQHEASVRAIGALNYIAMVAMGMLACGLFVGGGLAFFESSQPDDLDPQVLAVIMIVGGLLSLGFSVLSFFLGRGLRRLQSWARWTQGVLSSIQIPLSLLGFNPIGLLISIYITYLMFTEKSTVVFSDHYKAIIQRTPHIRPRTSMVVWVVLAIFLSLIVLGILLGILAGMGVL